MYGKALDNCCQEDINGKSTKSTNNIVRGGKIYGPIILYEWHKLVTAIAPIC